jgi:DNA-binding transcriptional MerR regulator/DNA-directed RNA polymerase subunit RPC12/RpoP
MSKYTTGELAKLCDVTVRTVQYYDSRGLLVPSELTEGGRRLYSEDDLRKMNVICFLRDIGLSINSITQLFNENEPEKVIHILLQQQKNILEDEISLRREQLNKIEALQKELKSKNKFSVESIGDVAYQMENKNKLRKVRKNMIIAATPMLVLEITAIIFAITIHAWWPVFAYLGIAVIWAVPFSRYYFNSVAYICPECHQVFKPALKEALFANHTPTTRKLTCPNCGHKGFCVETYGGDVPSYKEANSCRK